MDPGAKEGTYVLREPTTHECDEHQMAINGQALNVFNEVIFANAINDDVNAFTVGVF
jgi:hypothetical protein